jgi:hypothetical protein
MRASCRKGVTSHPDPWSCGECREVTTVAWRGASVERGEGTTWTKENAPPFHTYPTQRGTGVPQGLARVRQAARKPSVPFDAMHPR